MKWAGVVYAMCLDTRVGFAAVFGTKKPLQLTLNLCQGCHKVAEIVLPLDAAEKTEPEDTPHVV